MQIVTEEQSARLITHEIAYEAVRAALIAAIQPQTASFPVVLGHGSDPADTFTVKSGAGPDIAGLKVGSYWPGNAARGWPRHNSTVLLIDQDSGRIGAVIEAGTVNAYRTAAADAVATDALARRDASVLAVFGTGHQAGYEVAALARIRKLRDILAVGRSEPARDAFIAGLAERGIAARAAAAEEACRAADIIVTATTARAALFDAAWVRPGTHVSSMGSDATGKQELPAQLLSRARLFCDLPEQSRRIGEFQHAAPDASLTAIGAVLAGEAPGRRDDDEITVFDSSGLALQDLYVARALLALLG
ncbi:ornithine cyclodeaminase family protein [Pelagibacterium lacus]|uniref:Ornithine cyclodeaminase family protein n=1 Tax=Pelagibacterium lacus TaxID=2282655 RepID=A0A369W180_9HYPH|nr:ornithine cyclodeaminase family protein [Pelagibacterium lacus]RDE08113.1 ornithine cyclodeaminase family protein [Pelagibacterium lacus]